MSKYICEKGKEQYEMCKKYDADYCSDCPHSRKYNETMSKEEAIERLNDFKTISILYGNKFAMRLEQLEQLQKDIGTVLQLLEEKENIINDAIKCLETLQSGGTSCNCGDLQLVLDILEE